MLEADKAKVYRSCVGMLLYMMRYRPDIAYATRQISKGDVRPERWPPHQTEESGSVSGRA